MLEPSIKLLSIAEPDSFSATVGKSVTCNKNKTQIKKLFPSYDNNLLKKLTVISPQRMNSRPGLYK